MNQAYCPIIAGLYSIPSSYPYAPTVLSKKSLLGIKEPISRNHESYSLIKNCIESLGGNED